MPSAPCASYGMPTAATSLRSECSLFLVISPVQTYLTALAPANLTWGGRPRNHYMIPCPPPGAMKITLPHQVSAARQPRYLVPRLW